MASASAAKDPQPAAAASAAKDPRAQPAAASGPQLQRLASAAKDPQPAAAASAAKDPRAQPAAASGPQLQRPVAIASAAKVPQPAAGQDPQPAAASGPEPAAGALPAAHADSHALRAFSGSGLPLGPGELRPTHAELAAGGGHPDPAGRGYPPPTANESPASAVSVYKANRLVILEADGIITGAAVVVGKPTAPFQVPRARRLRDAPACDWQVCGQTLDMKQVHFVVNAADRFSFRVVGGKDGDLYSHFDAYSNWVPRARAMR
jgi:hypothetical protein